MCMLHTGGKPLGAFARWVASRGQTSNRPLLELSLQARCCRAAVAAAALDGHSQQETVGDRSVEGWGGRALPHRVCTVDLLTLLGGRQ